MAYAPHFLLCQSLQAMSATQMKISVSFHRLRTYSKAINSQSAAISLTAVCQGFLISLIAGCCQSQFFFFIPNLITGFNSQIACHISHNNKQTGRLLNRSERVKETTGFWEAVLKSQAELIRCRGGITGYQRSPVNHRGGVFRLRADRRRSSCQTWRISCIKAKSHMQEKLCLAWTCWVRGTRVSPCQFFWVSLVIRDRWFSQLVCHSEVLRFPIFIASGCVAGQKGCCLLWLISLHVWHFWYDRVCIQVSFVSLCPFCELADAGCYQCRQDEESFFDP